MAAGEGVDTMDEQALAVRARRGDRTAFGRLYEAHAPAAWRLALVVGRDPAIAAGAVVDASVHVLGHADRHEHDRFSPVSVQMLAAARSAAADARRLPSLVDHLGDQLPELSVLTTHTTEGAIPAFDELPERWRSVLWLRHVERLGPAEVAVVLGLDSPIGATQLATRAQRGLHEQLAQAQIASATAPGCQRTAARLAAYVDGTLEARDTVRVRRHLDRCEDCRQRLDEIDDLTPRIHRSAPALPVTLQELAEQRWFTDTAAAAGPLGLRLPNGMLAPAWVERTLAGATAGVVALGITFAVALGARRGDDPVARESAAGQALASPDGASALGGELPGEGGVDDSDIGGGPNSTDDPRPGAEQGSELGPTAPSSSGSVGSTAAPRGTSPVSPSEPTEPTDPAPAPPASPPTTESPSDPITEVVDEVEEVLAPVADLCTGVEAVDDLTCATNTTAPVLKL